MFLSESSALKSARSESKILLSEFEVPKFSERPSLLGGNAILNILQFLFIYAFRTDPPKGQRFRLTIELSWS